MMRWLREINGTISFWNSDVLIDGWLGQPLSPQSWMKPCSNNWKLTPGVKAQIIHVKVCSRVLKKLKSTTVMDIKLLVTRYIPKKTRRNGSQDSASHYFRCMLVAPSWLVSTSQRSTLHSCSWLDHRSDWSSFMALGEALYMRSRIQTPLSR